MKLDRYCPEIQDLHRRPNHVIGPQGGKIDVLKFLEDGAAATTLGNGHVGEEDTETDGGEDELVHGDALQGGDGAAGLGDGEGARQEAEPLELDGRHEEAVGHEAGEALEVEGGGALLVVGTREPSEAGFSFRSVSSMEIRGPLLGTV